MAKHLLAARATRSCRTEQSRTEHGLTQNLLPTRDILTFRNAHTRIRGFDWSPTMNRTTTRTLAAVSFVACILAANYVTARYGFIPVGFSLMATAGTYFAGLAFLARDVVQDTSGRLAVVALIIIGAALSWWLSTPALALASGVAFLVSELADMAVYTPLRAKTWTGAVVASNTVGAFIDSVIFLSLAGFPLWSALPGQMVAKVGITLATVAVVGLVRVASTRVRAA